MTLAALASAMLLVGAPHWADSSDRLHTAPALCNAAETYLALRTTAGPIRYHATAGNSVSIGGQGASGGRVITPSPPPIGRSSAFMFPPYAGPSGREGGGTRGRAASPVSAAALNDFVPAYEQVYQGTQIGETHLTAGMAWAHWNRVREGKPRATFVGRSWGAAGPAELLPGSTPFNNSLVELRAAVRVAAKYGRTVEHKWLTYVGGHQDRNGRTTTLAHPAAAGSMTLTLAATQGVFKGALVLGPGYAAGTEVTSVDSATRVVTLSQGLTTPLGAGALFQSRSNVEGYKARLSALHRAAADNYRPITGQAAPVVLASTSSTR